MQTFLFNALSKSLDSVYNGGSTSNAKILRERGPESQTNLLRNLHRRKKYSKFQKVHEESIMV
jgi:hypothetical protein